VTTNNGQCLLNTGYSWCCAKYLMCLFYPIQSSHYSWELSPAVNPYNEDEKQKKNEVNEPTQSYSQQ
jgi:hypothetical protein